jgi:type IV pilus assembly protein PilM
MSNFLTNPFKVFFPTKMVGIDIGTSSVKVVEVSRWGGGNTLENYGEISSESFYEGANQSAKQGNYSLSNAFMAKVIKGVMDEAKIKNRAAIFSIPDFFTFCTSFDIPPMSPKEIPDAIRYNASQYITLPISEVTLDWHVALHPSSDKNASQRVFLVAVPNQVIQQYQNIAKLAGLQLHAVEAETLGIARALSINSAAVRSNRKIVCVVDIGIQSSTINIIDRGSLKKSYSFNFASTQLSKVVSSALGVDQKTAESIKEKEGLMYPRQDIVKALYLLLDPLLIEIKSVCAEFAQAEGEQVEEIYLTGGTASLPGLKEYFKESLKKEVLVPNCFSSFLYPPILEDTLRQMSPRFTAAIGVALGGLEI